jgi:hypothetical protein
MPNAAIQHGSCAAAHASGVFGFDPSAEEAASLPLSAAADHLLELFECHPTFRVDAPDTTWELPISRLQAQPSTQSLP